MLHSIIRFFLENKLIAVLFLLGIIVWGIITAPFNWDIKGLPTDPVPVDAIPDIGENQQIVFTEWPGHSPQDIEDQISYPLTTGLLGIPGVKSIRSSSIFGFSSIYLIFDEEIDFYWSRSRIIEKLNSLPKGFLPDGIQPALGPDATALGQVFWYTLEGRDPDGNPTGGWDLHEVRSVQDFYVKYGLNATEGVSEVASIGGFVKEFQVDVNPEALRAYNISLHKVMQAVQNSNQEVGAKTIEINQAEYLVRGLGYVQKIEDIEQAVVAVEQNVPIRIKDVAVVSVGPANRRGLLDKEGAEVVGGVVVARYGSNPLEVIRRVKKQIAEIAPGLPKKILADGTESQLTIVPFYDRSHLIYETLGTLEEALSLEILISLLVVIFMMLHFRASLLITSLLPISILMVFIAMRYTGVDANIVALSGIAIAIGTMVDLGIILTENVLRHLKEAPSGQSLNTTIYKGATEISTAILTAVATTIVSFIPVFTLEAAEGKLFGPLAFTKTFALVAALLTTLLILPALAHLVLGMNFKFGIKRFFPDSFQRIPSQLFLFFPIIWVTWLLTKYWLPLGASQNLVINFIFVLVILGIILGGFWLLIKFYEPLLTWCLDHTAAFLMLPAFLILFASIAGMGFSSVFSWIERGSKSVGWEIQSTAIWSSMDRKFPGIGTEFMPALDEGSFLLMPSAMPHAGITFNRTVVGQLDMLVSQIPEVELAVGKLGRVESALDPAPISMFENVIQYKPEYLLNPDGHRVRFKVDDENRFILTSGDTLSIEAARSNQVKFDDLILNQNGQYFKNWRDHIHSPDDIWQEIIAVTRIPGVTSAPKLQPIETRLIMLQTGMRSPMGIKVFGPDLPTIESFGKKIEQILKTLPAIDPETVFADEIVGKPYLQLKINRKEISRYGLNIGDVQETIETAVGGKRVSTTVEGRERYSIRVRYPRELRDDPESLKQILIATPTGIQIPLGQLVDIEYAKGPQSIKSEGTFLVGYVLFDKKSTLAEGDVIEEAKRTIEGKISSGELVVPQGISYKFSGNYENQIRAEERLSLIVPLVLAIIFIILYLQFRSVGTSFMVFSGIAMAFSGGFIMIWLYAQPGFGNFALFGTNFQDLFQIHPINMSVAVWVGFIALFGIATDDGVLMATYLDQRFRESPPQSIDQIKTAVLAAAGRRIKPAVMTSATTLIALLPILSATGRGADIMIPMAIPSFGGMMVASITYFIVPVLYGWRAKRNFNRKRS